MAETRHPYESVECSCQYGFRTNPVMHDQSCSWRRAWEDFWSSGVEQRRPIYTEAYNREQEETV